MLPTPFFGWKQAHTGTDRRADEEVLQPLSFGLCAKDIAMTWVAEPVNETSDQLYRRVKSPNPGERRGHYDAV